MPRTGENIYKRKDGRWEARYVGSYRVDGRAKYKSVYGKSYAEARQKQRAAMACATPTQVQSNAECGTIEAAARLWLQNVRLRTKDSTFAKYQRLTEQHILSRLGRFAVGRIGAEQVERYVGDLLMQGRLDGSGGLSQKTVGDILTILKSIFSYAQVPCNLGSIKLKKVDREMRVFSKAEQAALTEQLLSNINTGGISVPALGVLLSLHTGIRLGELCALRWESIDLEAKTLHITQTMQRIQNLSGTGTKTRIVVTSPKSQCSIRMIPLPVFLVNLLRPFSAHPQAYFLTKDKVHFMEPRTAQNYFKHFVVASGIADANFHALRHTFATRCVEAGFEIKSLSEILGHSSVNITLNRYVHSSFDLKRANMEKLSL